MLRIRCSRIGLSFFVLFAFFTLAHPADAQAALPAGVAKLLPSGWKVEERFVQQGDLTGDGLKDVALVADDAANARVLLVFMQKRDGSFERIGANSTILLCGDCYGMMGDGPELSIDKRGVLVVDQLAGSRETRQDVWRFRFDPAERKMRLIGLDVNDTDRGDGSGTKESTNYLTGKRISETWTYSEKQRKSVLAKSRTSSVAAPKVFLDQVERKTFLPDE